MCNGRESDLQPMVLDEPALPIAPWLSASHDNVAQIVFFCSSAVCIERVPPLVPELSDLQKRMVAMLQQVEFEQSKKCEHELRHEEDL